MHFRLSIVRPLCFGGSLLLLARCSAWRFSPRGLGRPAPDAVTTSVAVAQAAGNYHFTSETTQVSLPQATIANVGSSSHAETLYLEGQNDLRRADGLHPLVWGRAGVGTQQAVSACAWRTEPMPGGSGRMGRSSTTSRKTLAPRGDFMSYLAAVKDVRRSHGQRNGIAFALYTFYHRQPAPGRQSASGWSPPCAPRQTANGIQLEVPAYFRDMVNRANCGWAMTACRCARSGAAIPAWEGRAVHAQSS